jgi:hypothetical protein
MSMPIVCARRAFGRTADAGAATSPGSYGIGPAGLTGTQNVADYLRSLVALITA